MLKDKWDKRFLALARFVAQWSKDPSTKVGAVIVDSNKRIVSLGFNGFPQGVVDTEERLNTRETKYEITVHAEINAILFSSRDLTGCTLYTWPFPPCSRCAAQVIQSGIKRVVAPGLLASDSRWAGSISRATEMFYEANLNVFYPLLSEKDF